MNLVSCCEVCWGWRSSCRNTQIAHSLATAEFAQLKRAAVSKHAAPAVSTHWFLQCLDVGVACEK